MKNFTNNFKQFTSRLSARWLIMVLMLLVGTSSAWGAYYVTGNVIGNWSEGANNRLEMTSHESDVVKAQVSQGGDFKIHYAATGWDDNWYKTIQKGTSTGATITGNDNGSNLNLTLQSGYSFPVTIYFDPSGNDGKPYVWAIATEGSSGGDEIIRIVAGTPASVFGTEWEPGNTNNEMTETSSGVYTIDYYTNFQSNTTIVFKVTDGTWNNSWPAQSKSHTIGEGCNKTTITYKTNGNSVEVSTDPSNHCCAAPTSEPTLSKVSDIVKCGTTTTTSGTLKIATVNAGSTYYYKKGTNGSDVQINFGNNNQFTVSSTGDYYVKEVNDCGASSSWSSKVTISETNNSVSISAITGPENICSGSSADYSITAIGGVSYNWSINSDKFTLGTNGSESISVTANGTTATSATLTIEATKSGCPTSKTKTINIVPLPTISTVSPKEGTVCEGKTISALENTLTITKSDNSTTKWYKGGEELPSTSVVESGEYTIKAVSNTASCHSSSGVTYNVTGITTIPTDLVIDINGKTTASICGGTATINAKASGATSYSLYNVNGDLVETKDGNANGVSFTVSDANTYKVKATNNCGSTEFSSGVTLTVNPVPSLTNVGNVTLCSSSTPISVAELIAETKATASNSATIKLYDGNGVEITSPININTQTTTTYKLKASTQTCSSDFVSFSLTVNSLPAAPTLTSPDPVCEGTTVNLPTGFNWYDAETGGTEVQNTAISVTGTYWAAAVQNGCESATRTRYDVTVNPEPTISISGNPTAVLYEDVTLTAEVTDGATVKWYEGVVEKGEGLTYVVTSETGTSKTITAKAFLNGCESEEVSKKVTFGEEDCEPEIITHTNKTKVRVQSPWSTIKIYAHSGQSTGSWPGVNMTSGTGEDAGYYVYTFESVSSNFKVIFNNGSSNGENQTVSGTATKGKVCTYTIGANSCSEDNNSRRCLTVETTTDYKTTGDVIITTPAVKMLSAFSEEGSGELSMTAQIVKTGCNGNMTYYFKYRLKGAQAWSQTTPQTATGLKAGDEINEIVTGLDQGGTYEIQAVINNNNEAVSNIIEYVVNIQETAISDVTLQLADGDGNVLQNQNQKYCVGSTAYIKLSYRGTAHKSLEWIAENELQPVNGKDKLFSYVVRGNETITANVANNENKGTPATGTIDINVYTIATTPDISIDRTEVCSTDPVGAKITVKAPQEGITYRAYKMVDDVETPHGDAVVADNAESIIINSIKETGTYYVKAWNAQCLDAIAVSLSKFAVTKIDASSNTIAISPETASTNPWMPVTVKVDKNSAYDYTLVCKQEDTDVTDQMVINKKGDSYVIKFPKPESAEIDKDGQVVFDDITYNVVATLNGDVQCGTTSATSTVTLTNLIEDCD